MQQSVGDDHNLLLVALQASKLESPRVVMEVEGLGSFLRLDEV